LVQNMHKPYLEKFRREGKEILNEGAPAQLMLELSPDQDGVFRGKSHYSDNVCSFQPGDFIKIENYHSFDIGIDIHHLYIPEDDDRVDSRTSTKYLLSPYGSLEFGIDDDTKDARIVSITAMCTEHIPFAVTRHGNLIFDNMYNDSCVFTLKKRVRALESMAIADSSVFTALCLNLQDTQELVWN